MWISSVITRRKAVFYLLLSFVKGKRDSSLVYLGKKSLKLRNWLGKKKLFLCHWKLSNLKWKKFHKFNAIDRLTKVDNNRQRVKVSCFTKFHQNSLSRKSIRVFSIIIRVFYNQFESKDGKEFQFLNLRATWNAFPETTHHVFSSALWLVIYDVIFVKSLIFFLVTPKARRLRNDNIQQFKVTVRLRSKRVR